jgi:hypothetical protein
MSVHVGEVHSDVVATASEPVGSSPGEQELAERLASATRRACWLAERVAAEGFDD